MKATGPPAPTNRDVRCLGVEYLTWPDPLTIRTAVGVAVIAHIVPRPTQPPPTTPVAGLSITEVATTEGRAA